MDENIVAEATQLANNASARGTFNIVNALNERAYPTEDVKVYLDEQTAYAIVRTDKQIDELEENASSDIEEIAKEAQEEQARLIDYRTELYNKLNDSLLTFNIMGVPEGTRESIINDAFEKFPEEFNEDRNIMGDVTRTPKPCPERDEYVTMHLWEKSIKSIVAKNGDTQVGVTLEDVEAMKNLLPVSATTKVTNSIEKLRVATAMFLIEVNEDFLAKP